MPAASELVMDFDNLSQSAIEMINGATPALSNQVKLALKLISEGTKTNSREISRDHLVGAIRYLLDEYGWLKNSVSVEENVDDEFEDAQSATDTPSGEVSENEEKTRELAPNE